MTAPVGGDIETVGINDVLYPVTSDVDASRALGGFENEVMANGDGSARMIKKRVPWKVSGFSVSVNDPIGNEQQNLQDVADGDDWVDIVINYASGASWSGKGTIVGELTFSNQNTAASFDLAGPDRLTRQ